jgi:hypothetical protein
MMTTFSDSGQTRREIPNGREEARQTETENRQRSETKAPVSLDDNSLYAVRWHPDKR